MEKSMALKSAWEKVAIVVNGRPVLLAQTELKKTYGRPNIMGNVR